jgi:hypothetical protein
LEQPFEVPAAGPPERRDEDASATEIKTSVYVQMSHRTLALRFQPTSSTEKLAEKHKFEFDTVQMPLNVMDAHFRSFGNEVLPVLVMKNIGVLGMKSMSSGHILRSKKVSVTDCLYYALNLPTSVAITGVDSKAVLDQAFEAAKSFSSVTKDELAAILEKAKPVATEGMYEPFKTSPIFDSTAAHPEWRGYNPQT